MEANDLVEEGLGNRRRAVGVAKGDEMVVRHSPGRSPAHDEWCGGCRRRRAADGGCFGRLHDLRREPWRGCEATA